MIAAALPSALSLSLADLEGHDRAAKTGGIERRFLCPFPACASHQNPKTHRSLTLNTETGAWNCKRCHEKGLLTEWHTHPAERADLAARPFVSKRDRDRDRLRSLLATAPRPAASKAEPDADTKRDLAGLLSGIKPLAETPGAAYLNGRGLPADFCHAAGVRFHRGFLGRPAVVFSLRDAAGRIVALHGRYTDGRSDPKSRTRGPMQQAVFATPGAWSGDPWQGRVVITEAPLDALTLAFCGVPAVALCGTSGGKELLRERLALRQAVAAFDADGAGHDAGRALAAHLAPVGCQVLRLLPPDGAKDWNEALSRLGPDALRDYLIGELSDRQTVADTRSLETRAEWQAVMTTGTAELVEACAGSSTNLFDVEPTDVATLLTFVQAAYQGTGADIRSMAGRIVWIEASGFVTAVWAGPASGRLTFGGEYWRAVKPFTFSG